MLESVQLTQQSPQTGKADYVSILSDGQSTTSAAAAKRNQQWNWWLRASAVLTGLLLAVTVILSAVHRSSSYGGGSRSSDAPLQRLVKDATNSTYSVVYDPEHSNRSLAMAYATYCNKSQIADWTCHFCNEIESFTLYKVIAYSDIKVILGYDEEYEVLVSAHSGGTALLNAIIWGPIPPVPYWQCDGCMAQAGIQDSYKDVKKELQQYWGEMIDTYGSDTPWVFTGYDWGGSFASLSALHLLDKLEKDYDTDSTSLTVYSFGQSRWANREMADYFDSRVTRHWRVTNQRDYMANSLPAFMGYKHTGTLVWYDCMETDSWQVCDGDAKDQCEPLKPYMADHRTYLQMKYGCSAEDRASAGMVSQCDGYITMADIKIGGSN